MARLLNLSTSTSTVAKRLKQLGLSAPAEPTPHVAIQGRPTKYTSTSATRLDDLHEIVSWWRDRRAALQLFPETSHKTERVTFQVERR